MEMEEMASRGLTAAPVSKLGPAGQDVLASIRAYPDGISDKVSLRKSPACTIDASCLGAGAGVGDAPITGHLQAGA